MNEDQIASLISEDEAKLIKEQIALKKKLNSINQQLKELNQKLKSTMLSSGIKKIESHGLKITYTKPRTYDDFRNKKFAIKVIKEIRPDLIETKTGYDRLTITPIKEG